MVSGRYRVISGLALPPSANHSAPNSTFLNWQPNLGQSRVISGSVFTLGVLELSSCRLEDGDHLGREWGEAVGVHHDGRGRDCGGDLCPHLLRVVAAEVGQRGLRRWEASIVRVGVVNPCAPLPERRRSGSVRIGVEPPASPPPQRRRVRAAASPCRPQRWRPSARGPRSQEARRRPGRSCRQSRSTPLAPRRWHRPASRGSTDDGMCREQGVTARRRHPAAAAATQHCYY